MKNLANWLDDAKAKSGSDYKTASELKITRQAISKARNKHSMSNNTARKLAEYLNVNPMLIIAAVEIEKHPEEKAGWTKWVAAMVILSVLGLSNNGYVSKGYAESAIDPFIHYTQLLLCVILSVAAYRVLKSLKFEKQY